MRVARLWTTVAILSVVSGCAMHSAIGATRADTGRTERHSESGGSASLTRTAEPPQSTPSLAPTVPGASDIAPGYEHLCVIDSGSVSCVGRNQYGQLGDGTADDSTTFVPTGIPDAVDLASGPLHSCAIRADRTVWCWGYGDSASPNNRGLDVREPRQVTGLARAREIAAGEAGTCAVTYAGDVVCWGSPDMTGETSAGTRLIAVPAAVSSVAVGSRQACALGGDGSVWCWGSNRSGQLVDGPVDAADRPVRVPGVTDAVAIAAGGGAVATACVVLADGSVQCWGEDSDEHLSGGSDPFDHSTPRHVEGLTNATSVAVGSFHACATGRDGSVWCWGRAMFLGAGATPTPASVVMPATRLEAPGPAVSIAAQSVSTCALRRDDTATCWGINHSGQLGNDSTTGGAKPVEVSALRGG